VRAQAPPRRLVRRLSQALDRRALLTLSTTALPPAADAQAMNVDDELDLPDGWPADDVENVEDGVIGGW
jgi:hypothetical protein